MLPSVFPRLATDSAGRVFPGVWKPLFLKFPSQDGLPFPGWSSLPTSFVSFFIFYIFSYLFLKTIICFSGCLMSSASLQKLFCGVCLAPKRPLEEFVREKVVFPSYSSAIFPSPSYITFLKRSSRCALFYSDEGSEALVHLFHENFCNHGIYILTSDVLHAYDLHVLHERELLVNSWGAST